MNHDRHHTRRLSSCVLRVAPMGALVLVALGCANFERPRSQAPATKPSANVVSTIKPSSAVFPGDKVCQYPLEVSDQTMHQLAGGNWEDTIVDGESLGYGCMVGRSSQREVKLASNGSFTAQIEYAGLGSKEGAEYIVVDYYVDLASQIPDESRHRQRYVRFIQDLVKATLGASPTPAIGKQINDLATYGPSGEPTKYEEKIGKGRVEISLAKGPAGGTIFAKAFVYPSGKSEEEQ